MPLLRACQGEQNSLGTNGSPERGGRRGRRAPLADSASELSSNILGRLALKVLIHCNQACATAPDENYALRPLRRSDKLRKQMGLAPRASHQLAAPRPDSYRDYRGIKYPLR